MSTGILYSKPGFQKNFTVISTYWNISFFTWNELVYTKIIVSTWKCWKEHRQAMFLGTNSNEYHVSNSEFTYVHRPECLMKK
jgi:hypothetical protein